ncbi:MAG: 30S ribosomal protein S16 [Candidatus Muirbacterium halophilum]|nr:30S ribosomal protein S16 [Candidatus Muirbacterium halophilum]MCK9475270.1 30S ribosomal protein S16 [Candidatus Muirbacterium halophilum]
MLKIRLKRLGTKKKPYYRIVVADARTQRDGKVVEEIGMYDPLTEPATVEVNEQAVMKYISEGAQPTHTVKSILKKQGILNKIHTEKLSK